MYLLTHDDTAPNIPRQTSTDSLELMKLHVDMCHKKSNVDEICTYLSFSHPSSIDDDENADKDVINMTHVKQTMWTTSHVVIDETEDKKGDDELLDDTEFLKSDEEAFLDAMDGRLERLIQTLKDTNIPNKVNN